MVHDRNHARSLTAFLTSLACTLGAAAAPVRAFQETAPSPGSLLLFPEYDNRAGRNTLLTVTNVDGSAGLGNVQVEFVYIDASNCQEFNRTETLTPRDTLTLLSRSHNFAQNHGYVYVFAKRNGSAVAHDHLVGQSIAVDGLQQFEYSMNALAYRALAAQGAATDADGDGRRDFNGIEYERVADRIDIPRFLGQGFQPSLVQSELILVALAGGSQFTTSVYFQIFNDNEETFSTTRTFFCWERVPLAQVAPIFLHNFLVTTNHDVLEIGGAALPESGWFWMDGLTATSPSDAIDDPAFVAVLLERSGEQSLSDLPFRRGTQGGEILSHSPFSDL